MWKKSLKARLTLYVILPVMLALLAVGGIGFYSAYNEAQAIYDSELSHVTSLMFALLRAEDEEELKHGHKDSDDEGINPDIIELGTDFEHTDQSHDRKLGFRIWRHGKLLFYSKNAANFGAERAVAGFSDQRIDNTLWRFYVLPDAQGGYTLEVAQESQIRTLLIARLLSPIFSPLALLLPIILVLVWIGLRTGLQPLLAVSEAVKQRSALDLTPLSTCHSLTEIAPLVGAINSLLANLDYALTKERRFTDFAAHELRTPIAIFKTQAQTALKATNDDERKMILEAQVKAADRATSMVDQLLTLARLEHSDIPTSVLAIADITRAIVDERMLLAEQKHVDLQCRLLAHPQVTGNSQLLSIMLSNVIDNAIKYTPAQGKIMVTVTSDNQGATISIRDNGPGIPEDKLPHVTEHFYRVAQHPQPGAGLGLTIVKRAAELIGVTFTLRNVTDGHGLEALFHFPESK